MEGGKRSRLLTCSASGRSHVKAVERRKPDSKAIHYIYIILYDDTLEKTKPQKPARRWVPGDREGTARGDKESSVRLAWLGSRSNDMTVSPVKGLQNTHCETILLYVNNSLTF